MLFRPSGPCCLGVAEREFLVAILMLFRPSGPCCLGVAEAPFLSLESWKTATFLVGSESNVGHCGAVWQP